MEKLAERNGAMKVFFKKKTKLGGMIYVCVQEFMGKKALMSGRRLWCQHCRLASLAIAVFIWGYFGSELLFPGFMIRFCFFRRCFHLRNRRLFIGSSSYFRLHLSLDDDFCS